MVYKEITAAERIEPENLLVEMSVTLNNLVRFYDENNIKGINFIVDKAQELSIKSFGHLTELDRLTAENERLQQQLKEKDAQLSSKDSALDKFDRELKSAQELNMELLCLLIDIKGDLEKEGYTTIPERIESLINKANGDH